jgi:hypothetical protein
MGRWGIKETPALPRSCWCNSGIPHYPFQPDSNNEGPVRKKYPLLIAPVASAELAVIIRSGRLQHRCAKGRKVLLADLGVSLLDV